MFRRFLFIPLMLFVILFLFVSPKAQRMAKEWLNKGLAMLIEWLKEVKDNIFNMQRESDEKSNTAVRSKHRLLNAEMIKTKEPPQQILNKGLSNVLSNHYIKQGLPKAGQVDKYR